MKKRINVYVDEATYKKFKIQSIKINRSVSDRVDAFIKSEVEKDVKN